MSLIAIARELAPRLAAHADAIERDRRLPPEVAAALADAGLFRMLVPEAHGGLEVAPLVFVRALEALALGDSAAAWCTMTAATTGAIAAYLPAEGADALWGATPNLAAAGIFAPFGRAVPVEGGYRVTGRWPFASGSTHAGWLMGGALVPTADGPRKTPGGQLEILSCFFPTDQVQIHEETWTSHGMRGTGSHDVSVEDVFVPTHLTASLLAGPARVARPLYQFPVFGLLALGVTAVALGVARRAIDTLAESARKKKVPGGGTKAHQSLTQVAVARAEGELRAARALVAQTVDEVWSRAQDGRAVMADRDKALLRLAATHAAEASVRVVDAMYKEGGGSAIYAHNPLQRHLRDVQTIRQHVMVQEGPLKAIGRVLLGIPTDTSQL